MQTNTASEMPVAAEPHIFHIIEAYLPRLEEKFTKLSRRAKKLGCEAPAFQVVGEHNEWQVSYECTNEFGERDVAFKWIKTRESKAVVYTGRVRVIKHVVLTGADKISLGGWTFVAVLDFELGTDNVIINTVPGTEEPLPTKYRESGSICEHCRHNRQRSQCYVVRHESGEYKQVGSTCLVDFLGHFATTLASQVEMLTDAVAALEAGCEGEEGFGGGGGGPKAYDLETYLAWCVKSIRERGWVSRKDADFGKMATADAVLVMMEQFAKGK